MTDLDVQVIKMTPEQQDELTKLLKDMILTDVMPEVKFAKAEPASCDPEAPHQVSLDDLKMDFEDESKNKDVSNESEDEAYNDGYADAIEDVHLLLNMSVASRKAFFGTFIISDILNNHPDFGDTLSEALENHSFEAGEVVVEKSTGRKFIVTRDEYFDDDFHRVALIDVADKDFEVSRRCRFDFAHYKEV